MSDNLKTMMTAMPTAKDHADLITSINGLSNQMDLATGNSPLNAMMSTMVKQMTDSLANSLKDVKVASTKTELTFPGSATPRADMTESINQLSGIMQQHLDQSKELVSHVKDHKDLTQKLLNATA
jgi:uncharacterized phage infection (PIP) family protein YhgE